MARAKSISCAKAQTPIPHHSTVASIFFVDGQGLWFFFLIPLIALRCCCCWLLWYFCRWHRSTPCCSINNLSFPIGSNFPLTKVPPPCRLWRRCSTRLANCDFPIPASSDRMTGVKERTPFVSTQMSLLAKNWTNTTPSENSHLVTLPSAGSRSGSGWSSDTG